MHKLMLIGPAVLAAGILVGCGGGGAGAPVNPGSLNTTRTLVGYVWVKSPSNPSQTQPQVVISPASTPPANYDWPVSGTVSLLVSGGQFLVQSAGSNNSQIFTRDLSVGNDILVSVSTSGTSQVTVTGANIMAVGTPQYVVQYNENLSDGFGSGTTHNLNSPGNPDLRVPNKNGINSLKLSFDGQAPTAGTFAILAGQKSYVAVEALDSLGISVPGVTVYGGGVQFALTQPGAQITLNPANNLIIPAFQGQLPANVTLTASITSPSAASSSATLNYGYGAPTAVSLAKDTKGTSFANAIDLVWQVVTSPVNPNAVSSAVIYATVTNKYGAAIPSVVLDWTNVKAPNNLWPTASGGNCFFADPQLNTPATQSTTDINGKATITVSTPTPADGPLTGMAMPPGGPDPGVTYLNQAPKAMNFAYATVHGSSVTSPTPATFRINRDMLSIKIREKDTDQKKWVDYLSVYQFHSYGVDVDNTQSDDPPGAIWSCVNTIGSDFIGSPGDDYRVNIPPGHSDVQSTSNAQMSGALLNTGKIAGEVTISVTYPGLATDSYVIEIWGSPVKLYFLYAWNFNWENPPNVWESGQTTYRPVPDNSFQGDWYVSEYLPDAGKPPKWHIYVYMWLQDGFGHLTQYRSTDTKISNPTATAQGIFRGTVTLITAPANSPGWPCFDIEPEDPYAPDPSGQGLWQIQWNWTGVWHGIDPNSTIAVPINIWSITPDGKGGYLPGKFTKVWG